LSDEDRGVGSRCRPAMLIRRVDALLAGQGKWRAQSCRSPICPGRRVSLPFYGFVDRVPDMYRVCG